MSNFTPDEKMLQQYIQKKLSPEDEEQLELWLAEHPEVLEDLELDLVMQEGIQNIELDEKIQNTQELLDTKPKANGTSLLSWIKIPAFSVAMLAIGFFVGTYLTQHKTIEVENAHESIIVPLSTSRASQGTLPELSNKIPIFEILISDYLLEDDYSGQIISNGQILDNNNDLIKDFGRILYYTNLKKPLPSGNYEVKLINQNTQEEISYGFIVSSD